MLRAEVVAIFGIPIWETGTNKREKLPNGSCFNARIGADFSVDSQEF